MRIRKVRQRARRVQVSQLTVVVAIKGHAMPDTAEQLSIIVAHYAVKVRQKAMQETAFAMDAALENLRVLPVQIFVQMRVPA